MFLQRTSAFCSYPVSSSPPSSWFMLFPGFSSWLVLVSGMSAITCATCERRCPPARRMRKRFTRSGQSCAHLAWGMLAETGVPNFPFRRFYASPCVQGEFPLVGVVFEGTYSGEPMWRYRFKDGEWKERGLGDSKLLRHRVRAFDGRIC